MHGWLGEQWTALSQWLEGLPNRTAAVLGAVGSAIGLVLWQYVLLPLLRKGWSAASKRLYPLLSGAIVLDRVWSLPKYLETLRDRVSHVSNPWLDDRQKLTDIVVPVSVTTGASQRERTELSALFGAHRTLVVIGDPGSGKTTGLKSIALGCLTRKLRDDRGKPLIPVFVSLRDLAKSKKTLDDFLVKELETLGFPRARRLVKRLERAKRVVFLLDGLDEVEESDRPPAIEEISALLERHRRDDSRCHVIVTSRPVGYDEQLRGNVDATVRMADFNLAEIRKFVSNWEFRPPKSRERLLAAIADRRPIFEICKNPLMLTIVTSLYRDYEYTLPESREEFYSVCIEALLHRWDAARDLVDRNKIQASYKAAFLEEFAFDALARTSLDFRETFLLEQIESFIRRRNYTTLESARFLAEILRSGLLARLQTGEILFAHKTLAESLAAMHLRDQPAELVELWSQKADAWLEVCSLFVAHPKTRDTDITRLLDAAEAKGSWNHLLILAGEAHHCPPENRKRIRELMAQRKDLWPSLDQRALSGLARLGDERLFTELVHSEVPEVRSRAILALSTVPDSWAMHLLGELLVRGIDASITTTALAAMGTDGLALVTRVMESHGDDELMILACLRILEKIGTVEAFETVLPFLWVDRFSEDAALTCARFLSGLGMRFAFADTTSISGWVDRRWESENQSLLQWAVPWVADSNKRALCARIIELLAQRARTATRKALDELLTNGTPLLTIPAAILAAQTPGFGRYRSFVPWTSHRIDQPRAILYEATRRSTSSSQKLWQKSDDSRSDVEYTHEASTRLFIFLLAAVFLLPLGVAVRTGSMSRWGLAAPIALFVAGFVVSVPTHRISTLFLTMSLVPLGLAAAAHIAFYEREVLADVLAQNRVLWWLAGIGCAAGTASAVYATWVLGGYWWLCLAANIPVALWYDAFGDRLVFVRRANPFATLLFRIDWAARAR